MNRLDHVRTGTASLLTWALLACSHAPAEVERTPAQPEPAEVAHAIKWDPTLPLACNAYLPDAAAPRQLLLNGRPWGPEWPAELTLQVWPLDSGSVAVSLRRSGEYLESDPRESVLYRLECSGTHGLEVLAAQDFADFGRALLDLDNGRLLYSAHGLWALNLASLETTRLGPEPTWLAPGCAADGRPVRDILLELAEGELLVRRYAACGPSGAVIGHDLWLTETSGYSNQNARRRSPVATIARDLSGHLWLGDGVACNVPGHVEAHSPGLIWHSGDSGESWSARVLPAPTGVDKAPVAPVGRIETGQRAGEIVALTAICEDQSTGAYGGNLYVSRDGGQHFSRLALPDGFADGNYIGGIANFELVDGQIEHIRAWPHRPGVFDRPAWETYDGGAHWTLSGDALVGDSLHSQWVAGDGWQFRATADGLLKSPVGTESGHIVFRSLDLQSGSELCLKAQPTAITARSASHRQQLEQRLDQLAVAWQIQGEHYLLTTDLANANGIVRTGVTFRRDRGDDAMEPWTTGTPKMRAVTGRSEPADDWRPFFTSVEVIDGPCLPPHNTTL